VAANVLLTDALPAAAKQVRAVAALR
jgi:hypothetical protein